MGSGEFFLASLVGTFFGTVALAYVMYECHRFGKRLGMRARVACPLWLGVLAIALGVWPVTLWPFLTGWNGFLCVGLSIAFHGTAAFPMAMGYLAAREDRERESRRRFRKNADDWLGEWECEHAPMSSEDGG